MHFSSAKSVYRMLWLWLPACKSKVYTCICKVLHNDTYWHTADMAFYHFYIQEVRILATLVCLEVATTYIVTYQMQLKCNWKSHAFYVICLGYTKKLCSPCAWNRSLRSNNSQVAPGGDPKRGPWPITSPLVTVFDWPTSILECNMGFRLTQIGREPFFCQWSNGWLLLGRNVAIPSLSSDHNGRINRHISVKHAFQWT